MITQIFLLLCALAGGISVVAAPAVFVSSVKSAREAEAESDVTEKKSLKAATTVRRMLTLGFLILLLVSVGGTFALGYPMFVFAMVPVATLLLGIDAIWHYAKRRENGLTRFGFISYIAALIVLVALSCLRFDDASTAFAAAKKAGRTTLSSADSSVSKNSDSASKNSASKNSTSGNSTKKAKEKSEFPKVTLTESQRDEEFGWVDMEMLMYSLPSQAENRREQIKAAGGPKFEDAISIPRRIVTDLANLAKLSDDKKSEAYKATRRQIEEEIIRNPIYGDAFLQLFSGIDYITENNSWLLEAKAKVDTSLAEGGQGWDAWITETTLISGNGGKKGKKVYRTVITNEWFTVAAKICHVIQMFEIEGVDKRQTIKNWCLPPQGEASFIRTKEAKYQEKWEALIFVFRGKDDSAEQVVFGVNVWDGRPELFGGKAIQIVTPKAAKKGGTKSTPSTPKDPGGGSTPGATPTPGVNPPGDTPNNTPAPNPNPDPTDPPVPTDTPVPTDPPSNPDPTKDPAQDPVNQNNAQIGGGENLPSDGGGDGQPDAPPADTYEPYVPAVDNSDPALPEGDMNGGSTFDGDDFTGDYDAGDDMTFTDTSVGDDGTTSATDFDANAEGDNTGFVDGW